MHHPIQTLLKRAPIMLAALWWGGLTLLCAVVVPLLFVHLPTSAMAGQMAAKLFTVQTWISTLCGLLLLMLSRRSQGEPAWAARFAVGWIIAGTLFALLLEFAVTPRILARQNMALWHGLGVGLYLLQWLCAGVTLWRASDSNE
ncbi:MAG: DUF4149 domain-containing protein [Betaproteobacteria bacterium]